MGSKIRKSAHFYREIGKSATFAKLAIENENLVHSTYIMFLIKFGDKNVCYSLLLLDFSLKCHKALKRCKLLLKSLLNFLHHKKRMFANVYFADKKLSPPPPEKLVINIYRGRSRPK